MKEEPQMEYKLSQVNLTILQVNNRMQGWGRKELSTLEISILAGYCKANGKKNCTQILYSSQ